MRFNRYGFILLVASVLLAFPKVQAQEMLPQNASGIVVSFAPIVKKVAPAVVNIYTKSRVQVSQGASPLMNDPFFKQFFGGDEGNAFTFGGRPREQITSSLGSGVIVRADGTIVTSYHVVKDAQEIKVALADKREFAAKVIVKDPKSDLAFLKIDASEKLPFIDMRDSDSLEVGDRVLAIGNPFGIGQTVTSGIVSALARAAAGVSDYQFFIQTDAAINPGNSGGALVDMNGKLIGINTAIYTRSGGSNGIGFAIPANMVRSLLDSKAEGGRVVRPWIGLTVQPLTPQIADSLGLDAAQGVMVVSIASQSPAEKSGMREKDVITAINNTAIASEADMQYRLALMKIGDTASFKIIRDGKPQEISMALTAPPDTPRDQRTMKGKEPLNGVTLANLSPALALELGIDTTVEGGVVVVSSKSNVFNAGDMMLEVNGSKVTSTAQLEKLLKAGGPDWKIVFKRGGNILTLKIHM